MSVAQLSRGIARLFPELSRTDIDPSRFARGVFLGMVLGVVGGVISAVLFWPIGVVGLFAPLLVILLAKASIAVSVASNREGIDREFVFILSELQFAVIVGSGYETVIDGLASNRDLKYAAKAAQLAKRIMRMSPGIHPLDAIMSALKKLNASEKLLSLYNSILKAVEMGEDVAARINTIVNTLVSDFLDSMTRRVNNVVEAISALMASMMDFVLLMIAMSMSSGGAPIFNLAIGLVILPAVFYFVLWGLVSIPYMEMYVSPRALIPFAAAVAVALLVSPFAGAAVSLLGYAVLRRESATWRAYLRNSMEFIIDLAQNLKSAPVLQVLNALAKSKDYGPFNVFVLRLARAAESGEDLSSLVQGFRIPKLSRVVMRILFDTLRLGRISVAILDSLITFTVGLRSLTDKIGKSMMIVKIIIVLTTIMAILITYFTATLSSVIVGVAGTAGAARIGAAPSSMFIVGKLMVINIAMASLFLSRTDFNIVNSLLYFGLFSIVLGAFDVVAPSIISLMFPQPATP